MHHVTEKKKWWPDIVGRSWKSRYAIAFLSLSIVSLLNQLPVVLMMESFLIHGKTHLSHAKACCDSLGSVRVFDDVDV